MRLDPLAPGSWLGLLGGGQLGRMFSMAAQSMGYRVAVLDPGTEGPAASVADRHVVADYLDPAGLATLAATCAAATTEFENVPAQALRALAQRLRVSPSAESVAIAQDRVREKTFLADAGFSVAPFAVLRSEDDCGALDPGLVPGIVKTARFGYDGKGQVRVAAVHEVPGALRALGGQTCVMERLLPLAKEVSVLVARGADGETDTWPVAENAHRGGILDTSVVPARIDPVLARSAREIAVGVARAMDYTGVLCVEMFVLDDGRLVVNEIAPRPHNSGHYTIDACVTSQFEQQVRVMAGLPLGETRQHTPAVMVNLLGDIWAGGTPPWHLLLRERSVKLHLYGKHEARPGRKMGHLTCLAPTLEEALARADAAKRLLGMPQ